MTKRFVIDLVSCLPVGYIGLILEAVSGGLSDSSAGGEGGSSNTRAFKALRLLRLAKMLRIAKVLKVFEKYAESLSTFAGVYIMVFLILFLAHLMSCFWYAKRINQAPAYIYTSSRACLRLQVHDRLGGAGILY